MPTGCAPANSVLFVPHIFQKLWGLDREVLCAVGSGSGGFVFFFFLLLTRRRETTYKNVSTRIVLGFRPYWYAFAKYL